MSDRKDHEIPALLPGGQLGTVALEDYHGSTVLLIFYPGDFMPLTTEEITDFAGRHEDFKAEGCQILACSTDSAETHFAWATTNKEQNPDALGFLPPFPLLGDHSQRLTRRLDLLDSSQGAAKHALLVLDAKGAIKHKMIGDNKTGFSVVEALDVVSHCEKNQEEENQDEILLFNENALKEAAEVKPLATVEFGGPPIPSPPPSPLIDEKPELVLTLSNKPEEPPQEAPPPPPVESPPSECSDSEHESETKEVEAEEVEAEEKKSSEEGHDMLSKIDEVETTSEDNTKVEEVMEHEVKDEAANVQEETRTLEEVTEKANGNVEHIKEQEEEAATIDVDEKASVNETSPSEATSQDVSGGTTLNELEQELKRELTARRKGEAPTEAVNPAPNPATEAISPIAKRTETTPKKVKEDKKAQSSCCVIS